MLKAPQVATILGISARAVYDLADKGILAHYRLGVDGGAVRFAPEDVEASRPTTSPLRTCGTVGAGCSITLCARLCAGCWRYCPARSR